MWIMFTVLFLSIIFWIRHDTIDINGNELNKKKNKNPRKYINWDKICWSKQLEIEIIGQRYSYIKFQKEMIEKINQECYVNEA